MHLRKIVLFPIVLLLLSFSFSAHAQIRWHSVEEAAQLSKVSDKKIIVDVYTSWCGWCVKMDNTTFSDPDIVDFINENFIPVKFNAEEKKTITLGQQKYEYVKNGRNNYNEYANHLLRGNLQFPSIVFLDSNFKIIQPIPGYQEVDNLQMILIYYNNNYHKKMSWEAFTKKYREEQENNDNGGAKPVLINGK